MARSARKRFWALTRLEVRRTLRCIVHPAESPWSKLIFLAGLSYLFVPLDLIPDRIPIVGHFDEFGFLFAGFVGARFSAGSFVDNEVRPASRDWTHPASTDGAWAPDLSMRTLFRLRILQADLGNFFLLQFRQVDGFLITGKNSGTHWLKFMLSIAIAKEFDVPPPARSSGREADAIIGHPRWPVVYPHLPRIGSSHTIPSVAFAWRWTAPWLGRAPVVLLVRDIHDAMISNYVKWRARYDEPFSDYVKGDPTGRRHVADAWWYVHFFNRWGDVAASRRDRVLIVRYEDLRTAPDQWLRRAAAHLGIALSDEAVAAALEFAGRRSIHALLDPRTGETIIPPASARDDIHFTRADEGAMAEITRRFLRHDFGYTRLFQRAERPGVSPEEAESAHTPS